MNIKKKKFCFLKLIYENSKLHYQHIFGENDEIENIT